MYLKPENIEVLLNPYSKSKENLILMENDKTGVPRQHLAGEQSGQEFPVLQGIPVFSDNLSAGANPSLQFYQFIAPFYNLLHSVPAMRKGGEHRLRQEYLQKIKIKPNDRVLEVAVGTGANLRYLPKNVHYFGLDLSWEMLKQCQRAVKRLGLDVDLFLGNAENLPFKDDVFDVVFNVCALRLFNDKAKAVREMLRVAKPGKKIYIVDQNKTPVPLDLIPKNYQVEIEDSPGWQLYCLTITKP